MSNPIKIFGSLEAANLALPLDNPRKMLVNDRPLFIVRTKEGIFASDNMCPHSKASLSEGNINPFNEIVCPLHEYRFDLRTGRESSQRCGDLQTFDIRIEEDGIFLSI